MINTYTPDTWNVEVADLEVDAVNVEMEAPC